jgi:hypothetical protein
MRKNPLQIKRTRYPLCQLGLRLTQCTGHSQLRQMRVRDRLGKHDHDRIAADVRTPPRSYRWTENAECVSAKLLVFPAKLSQRRCGQSYAASAASS